MLDIFIGEAFTVRTLRQPDALPERFVVCFRIGRVQLRDRVGALDANWHGESAFLPTGVTSFHGSLCTTEIVSFAICSQKQ